MQGLYPCRKRIRQDVLRKRDEDLSGQVQKSLPAGKTIMKWTRIGPTAWESGKYRIAAAKVGEKHRYTLLEHATRDWIRIGTFDSPEAARKEAEKRGCE
jgi:hypothetical protein